ncbi:symmetrical bis(5'-nucleosyl)-tetraphosphatase [Paraferrimonas sp. SM1919]|uniref:symmetrical bis(5'-nucleosyl)-tetraphosphatase n=1 Tax=Paraferrimonas sp. SM1919 TaxID=2662263 RepID=UPI0013D3AE6D|nr:symmetrical bis(5'-nucleosyl)-tetraphosphatase [Paraferrimonas sp. SM1919]
MAQYVVGDIQGCYKELQKLLSKVDFNPSRDELWCVGDLVARGPDSLKTLAFLYQLEGSAKVVLGNHDLHLLAVAHGLKKANPKDKLNKLLNDSRLPIYLQWLRQQPLLRHSQKHNIVMTHAGIPPAWDLANAKTHAQRVEQQLQSSDYLQLLSNMYSKQPKYYCADLSPQQSLRYTINALTRMRFVDINGGLDFEYKHSPYNQTVAGLMPWFVHPQQKTQQTIIFGHWAALMGRTDNPDYIALDTGCVWGNYLTLLDLQTKQVIHQKSLT